MNPNYGLLSVRLTRPELEMLLDGTVTAVRRDGVVIRMEPDKPQRTGRGLTRPGPVMVRFPSVRRSFAYDSTLPLAIGDTVEVEGCYRHEEGVVEAFGAGGYCGPLKFVVAIKAVRP